MLETHPPGEIKKSCPPRHPLGDAVHCSCLPRMGDSTRASRTHFGPGWGHLNWQQFRSLSSQYTMLTVAGMNGECVWGWGMRGPQEHREGRSQEEEERKGRRREEGGRERKGKPCVRRKHNKHTGYSLAQCRWRPLHGHRGKHPQFILRCVRSQSLKSWRS